MSLSIPGFNFRLYISTDGGGTYNEIGELKDVSIAVTTGEYDSTSHDTQGWDTLDPGNRQWSAKAAALHVPANAAQLALATQVLAGNKFLARFDPSNTATGKERWTGTCFISNFEISGPNKDLVAASIDFKGSSSMVRSIQP